MSGDPLGPLGDLPGTWEGNGLSVTVRQGPDRGSGPVRQVNATHEAIAFAAVGPLRSGHRPHVPDRGPWGVQYVHQGSDARSGDRPFVEQGIWLVVPPDARRGPAGSVVRYAVLASGEALLADGSWNKTMGPPQIASIALAPIDLASEQPIEVRADIEQVAAELPAGVSADALCDPNALLRSRIGGREITTTITLRVSTPRYPEQPALNSLFDVTNPAAVSVHTTLWIETLDDPRSPRNEVSQLQYSQRVVDRIGDIGWPRVSVATLARR